MHSPVLGIEQVWLVTPPYIATHRTLFFTSVEKKATDFRLVVTPVQVLEGVPIRELEIQVLMEGHKDLHCHPILISGPRQDPGKLGKKESLCTYLQLPSPVPIGDCF